MEQSPSWGASSGQANEKIAAGFCEGEYSLPYSQEPTIGSNL